MRGYVRYVCRVCALVAGFASGCGGEVAEPRLTIRFDYRFDHTGFYDAGRRTLLERAAQAWTTRIASGVAHTPADAEISMYDPAVGAQVQFTLGYRADGLVIFPITEEGRSAIAG